MKSKTSARSRSGVSAATPEQPVSRPLFYLLIAAVAWLVPFFWSGWTGRNLPSFPRSWSFQHTAAGLFTKRSTVWWDQHIEVQARDDSRHELSETAIFPMGAFGYRTRYDRILMESNRSSLALQVRRRLAEHIFQKLAEAAWQEGGAHGIDAEPKAIRLVRTLWHVGSPELSNPVSGWSAPPVDQVTRVSRSVLGTYMLAEGTVIALKPRTSMPTRPIVSASPARTAGAPVPALPPQFRGGASAPRVIRRLPPTTTKKGMPSPPAIFPGSIIPTAPPRSTKQP